MKILHFHTSMATGGIEAMICGLANEMSRVGHDVTIATIFAPQKSNVFYNKLSPKINKRVLGKNNPGFSIKEIWAVYRTIYSGSYEVVNIHGFFYYYFLSILLLHRCTRFFYTVHSDAFKENSFWDKRFFPLKRLFFKLGWMHPITISQESQSSFRRCYALDSTLIYNGTNKPIVEQGIDLSEYKITNYTKILFHPGRISEAKNQVMLCSVCSRLIAEGYDLVLLIAGQNQNDVIMTKLLSFINNRIIYLGERSDVTSIMASSDAFCLSSIWEGMPVSLLEALSVGCIPICTPVGGIPEIIENNANGFLAKSKGEEDYYLAMKSFLDSDNSTLLSIKEKVKKSFSNFDISSTAKKYIDTYKFCHVNKNENISNHTNI